jgi:hypothetical protein
MKIGFNFLGCGMGNNGGTRTIIKCHNTMKELGHESYLISSCDNFNWFEHDKPLRQIPNDLDVLIATACTTVNSTLKSNAKKKAWYIRAHENWTYSDQQLSEIYKRDDLIKICNSNGMKHIVESYGGKNVKVVYQGVDLDFWKDLGTRKNNSKKVIGCLYSGRPGFVGERKRWSDFRKLQSKLGNEYDYVGFGDTQCPDRFVKKFLVKPSSEQLRDLYNMCDIWFAPTISEGLHNPPIEAGLCGCLVVCNDNKLNGMVLDYAFDGKTAMVYRTIPEAVRKIKNPNWDLTKKMKNYLIHNISDRTSNMERFIKEIDT